MEDTRSQDAPVAGAPDDACDTDTYYAPAERAEQEALEAARAALLSDTLAVAMLDSLPDPVMVVNAQRQVVAGNGAWFELAGVGSWEELVGLRPGEAAGCIHREDGPGGCGTGRFCAGCGVVEAVLESLRSGAVAMRECRMRVHRTAGPAVLDVLVRATPLRVNEFSLAVVALRDISDEKRRRLLERVFFHDVLNNVSKIGSLAYLLDQPDTDSEAEAEYRRYLQRLALEMAEVIHGHRELLAAEQGELRVKLEEVPAAQVLEQVVNSYRHHELSRGRTLQVGRADHVVLHTDPGLLRRVLDNLVKNALEATPEGGTVTVGAEAGGPEATFSVHNPGAIPDDLQSLIFQRSFSTKPGEGRGVGTHSVKLFTERYLGGRAGFTSSEAEGTRFTIALPLRRATSE